MSQAPAPPIWRSALIAAALLALFAVIGVGIVAYTEQQTAGQIAENQRNALLQNVAQILPNARYNNDLYNDYLLVTDPLLGDDQQHPIYRARQDQQAVGLILSATAPDGYNGSIHLLIGIDPNGQLLGVRVLDHKETPGLGDNIDLSHSDWITRFQGHSLSNPGLEQWHVKKDGGIFDQFTGATITPRAVVQAIRNALIYYQRHQQTLYTDPAHSQTAAPGDH